MIKKNIKQILGEIDQILEEIDEYHVELIIKDIVKAKHIVVCGAGRMGLVSKAFAMRLGHLGKKAYTLGDSNTPRLGKGDLFLISSGSGETQTIYDLTLIAKESGAKIAIVTTYIDHNKSRMAKISDTVVIINAPTKLHKNTYKSIQPMTTLNEQCLQIFFDALVLLLMKKLTLTEKDLWKKHTNLE